MSAINDGGPAFPVWELNGHGQQEMTCFGMSLRDYLAAKVMQGELAAMVDPEGANCGVSLDVSDSTLSRIAAHWYRIADAMLAARAKSTGGAA